VPDPPRAGASAPRAPRTAHNLGMTANATPLPPRTPAWRLDGAAPAETLSAQGFVRLAPTETFLAAGIESTDFAALARHWSDLPPDEHLRDGGRYRFRRHASLVLSADGTRIERTVDRPHWQPTDYNALHGGVERRFAPVTGATLAEPALRGLVLGLGRVASAALGHVLPFVEFHQFRIDTTEGIGRPTPEGAHRDGVDAVAVVLVDRVDVRGGETRVFEAEGPAGLRFTMATPGTALLLDDARMIHETTPLQPDGRPGHRDTVVLTWRREGFLDPPPTS
jgi:hypothetical protein